MKRKNTRQILFHDKSNLNNYSKTERLHSDIVYEPRRNIEYDEEDEFEEYEFQREQFRYQDNDFQNDFDTILRARFPRYSDTSYARNSRSNRQNEYETNRSRNSFINQGDNRIRAIFGINSDNRLRYILTHDYWPDEYEILQNASTTVTTDIYNAILASVYDFIYTKVNSLRMSIYDNSHISRLLNKIQLTMEQRDNYYMDDLERLASIRDQANRHIMMQEIFQELNEFEYSDSHIDKKFVIPLELCEAADFNVRNFERLIRINSNYLIIIVTSIYQRDYIERMLDSETYYHSGNSNAIMTRYFDPIIAA